MMATYHDRQNIVTTLLKNGADRCARDNKGITALVGAIFKLEWSIAIQMHSKQDKKITAEFAEVIGQEKELKN